jgi:hypothetical protein
MNLDYDADSEVETGSGRKCDRPKARREKEDAYGSTRARGESIGGNSRCYHYQKPAGDGSRISRVTEVRPTEASNPVCPNGLTYWIE